MIQLILCFDAITYTPQLPPVNYPASDNRGTSIRGNRAELLTIEVLQSKVIEVGEKPATIAALPTKVVGAELREQTTKAYQFADGGEIAKSDRVVRSQFLNFLTTLNLLIRSVKRM